jgi:hypothetical protein
MQKTKPQENDQAAENRLLKTHCAVLAELADVRERKCQQLQRAASAAGEELRRLQEKSRSDRSSLVWVCATVGLGAGFIGWQVAQRVLS